MMPNEGFPSINVMALIPPRVNVAMNAIALFTQKQNPIVVAGPDGIDFHDGQQLSPTEKLANEAAANLLRKYFVNDLEPDVWDSIMINTASPDNEPPAETACPSASVQETPSRPTQSPTPYVEFPCGICAGKTGNIGCHLCRGCGKIAIFPRSSIQG